MDDLLLQLLNESAVEHDQKLVLYLHIVLTTCVIVCGWTLAYWHLC